MNRFFRIVGSACKHFFLFPSPPPSYHTFCLPQHRPTKKWKTLPSAFTQKTLRRRLLCRLQVFRIRLHLTSHTVQTMINLVTHCNDCKNTKGEISFSKCLDNSTQQAGSFSGFFCPVSFIFPLPKNRINK